MYLGKKILIIIPARGGSKGIKLKNLKKIIKKSLLEISIDFAKSLKITRYITVSSDHKKILEIAKRRKVYLTKRTFKLSKDFVSDYDVIKHAVKDMEKKTNINFNIIVYLQPTSPFRKKKDIYFALEKVIKKKYDSSISVTPVNLQCHPKKVFRIVKNNLRLYLNSGLKIIARQQLDQIYIRNGIFYIFDKKKLFKKKNIYLKNIYPHPIRYNYFNIDNIQDLSSSKDLARKNKLNF